MRREPEAEAVEFYVAELAAVDAPGSDAFAESACWKRTEFARTAVVTIAGLDEIRFEGLQKTNPEVLRALLESRPGEPLTEEKISADLRRIYGRGDFESVDYYIQQDPGKRVLVIQPREKEWGPDYLRFGLGLATDFQGENYFNILAQYRRTWLNRLGGEWLNQVQVGKNTFFATEFTMTHLGLPADLQKNIKLNYYDSGHMMYLRDEDRAALHNRIADFIDRATLMTKQ